MTVRWHPAGGRGRLKALVAERVRERIDPGGLAVSAAERRLRVREEALGVLREHRVVMPARELTGLVNEVSDEVVGLGAIEGLLRDPEITEVMVNGPDDVFVERKGPLITLTVDVCYSVPMKALGYVRISKLDDRTTSPPRQREAIRRLCEERGWELVKVYEDLDVSGYSRNGKRPGLDKMMARLDEVDALVFWKLDRLARGVAKFYGILQRAEAATVALVSTAEPFDTSSPMGRAMVGITAIFAELESDVISERAKSMHAHLKEQGRWVGRVPFGWRLGEGKLVPQPSEQAIIRNVAERYVSGESLRRIAPDTGIAHANLARMLRTDRVLDALPRPLAGRLARELAERGREGTRAKRSLLGGIARCDVCGAGLTVVGRAKWGGSYVCREKGHVSISRPWLDSNIGEQVIAAIDTGELVKRIEKRSRKRPGGAVQSQELEARLELLERDHYERGIIPRDRYLRRREGILRRLQEARDAEEDVGIDLPRELAENLGERWGDLTTAEQRRIIAAILQQVTVAKATNHGKIDPSRVELIWRT